MLKAGVIGVGTMGQKYLNLMVKDPRIKVLGVHDINEEKASAVAQKYGVRYFTDYRELLDCNPDFVYIGTPDFAHTEIAVLAAKKGINLLIEKPLAMSVHEAEQIVNAVRANRVKAKVCFCNRWNPPFVVAKQAVDNGAIGNIISIYARLNDTLFVPTKMLSWSSRTSPGWFLMSHTLDLARWYIGSEAVKVFATGQKKLLKQKYGIDTYDSLHAIVHFRSGAVAVLESGWILPESFPMIIDFKFQIIGEKGCIEIDTHDQMLHMSAERYQHLPTIDITINERARGQVSWNFEDFIDCLLEGREPSATVEDGLANTRVLEAIHKAADSGGALLLLDQ